ncbi:hypothetical protein V8C86DRAFT_2624018 [Haematococcus lacustris]
MLSTAVQRPHIAGTRRAQVCRAAADVSAPVKPAVPVEPILEVLRSAARQPGSVPPPEVLKSLVALEQAKLQPSEEWQQWLTDPATRWRLIYTAPAKDVMAASKGSKGGGGRYFPIPACQKFVLDEMSFENGVFLGPLASLTFKGPYLMKGRRLMFDVNSLNLGLGPWRLSIPLKASTPFDQLPPKEQADLPFFLYAYLDSELLVGRGRSGGLALWRRADPEWSAKAGVLQVYK